MSPLHFRAALQLGKLPATEKVSFENGAFVRHKSEPTVPSASLPDVLNGFNCPLNMSS